MQEKEHNRTEAKFRQSRRYNEKVSSVRAVLMKIGLDFIDGPGFYCPGLYSNVFRAEPPRRDLRRRRRGKDVSLAPYKPYVSLEYSDARFLISSFASRGVLLASHPLYCLRVRLIEL